ncbi:hypothetical protein FAM09_22350 [Niastella caeni]|uniref:Glycosyltransferase RgtA/B/C/D-like domain-containing protein n=1 Tax=Niastella caeni TaxID=2569763 RepID=A0A4S8HP31_9BACT|nr:hypothetical protein [Niastella caeni]THU34742.1 hypothetical protein FAM09_22350 [Niastella caeni]
MTDNNTLLGTQYSFKEFLFNNRRNQIILLLAAGAIIIQFAVFKYLYPYASFIHDDSFDYLKIAYYNLDIYTYPVGYPRFLRLFSVFTSSDTALVAFQYLLIQSSALFFLFTLFYFYNPGKTLQIILVCFMVVNPLFLHLANHISSDGLFLALSLIWVTLLLWIIHRPSTRLILWHVLILIVAFTVRYNALIYPFITALTLWLSPFSLRKKIVSLTSIVLFCGLFVCYTSYKYKKLTGYWQYSPFSGWQLTNNAMYAYRYVESGKRKPVPARFKVLDKMVCTYFDSTRDVNKYPHEALQANTVYMWSPGLPLYKYMNIQFKNDSTADEMKRWASMGPLYADYGIWLIKHYPLQFARYFLWPNANKYYAPPIEFFQAYNSGRDYVAPIAKAWFGYKSHKVTTRMKNMKVTILDYYSILSGVMNVMFLCSLLGFIIMNGLQSNIQFSKGIILISAVWLINLGFTIFASSAALRFLAFPIMLISTFALLLVDCLVRMGIAKSDVKSIQPEEKNNDSEMLTKSFV